MVVSVVADLQPGGSLQSTEAAGGLLSRKMLESIEQELIAIRSEARELVWNMDREQAVQTAHAQQQPEVPMAEGSLHRWESTAALVGAAVAGVVYAQNEIVKDKRKVTARFSQQLIQPVWSSGATFT